MRVNDWKRTPRPEKETAMALLNSGMKAREVAEATKVPLSSVYNWQAQVRSASLKERIFEFVTNNQPTDAAAIATDLGADVHNVVHVMYSLQKQGRISFREEKVGHRTTLVNVKLVENGRSNGYAHDVAVVDVPPEPTPEPPSIPEGYEPQYGATGDTAGTTFAAASGDHDRPAMPTASAFPLIVRLADRERNLHMAADLLRLAGQTELADMSLEAAAVATDLELEVIALVDGLRRSGWWLD